MFIQGLASFVAGLGIAFWKSWEMTLVVLSLVPLLIISLAFISKVKRETLIILIRIYLCIFLDGGEVFDSSSNGLRKSQSHN